MPYSSFYSFSSSCSSLRPTFPPALPPTVPHPLPPCSYSSLVCPPLPPYSSSCCSSSSCSSSSSYSCPTLPHKIPLSPALPPTLPHVVLPSLSNRLLFLMLLILFLFLMSYSSFYFFPLLLILMPYSSSCFFSFFCSSSSSSFYSSSSSCSFIFLLFLPLFLLFFLLLFLSLYLFLFLFLLIILSMSHSSSCSSSSSSSSSPLCVPPTIPHALPLPLAPLIPCRISSYFFLDPMMFFGIPLILVVIIFLFHTHPSALCDWPAFLHSLPPSLPATYLVPSLSLFHSSFIQMTSHYKLNKHIDVFFTSPGEDRHERHVYFVLLISGIDCNFTYKTS